jgi:hypothetical protein
MNNIVPIPYPNECQIWRSTPNYPYPMNFMQAPSFDHQKLVRYRGDSYLQGLSTIRGPFMFPTSDMRGYPTRDRLPPNYHR